MNRPLLSGFAAGLVLPLALAGQAPVRPDTLAWAGPAGVYVWLGGAVVSRAHPVGGIVAHRVERRRPGAAEWERLADVEAVASAGGLFEQLDAATRAAVVRALGQRDETTAWAFILRFPRADSLSRVIGDERVRLALGIYALDDRARGGGTWEYRVGDLDQGGVVRRSVVTAPVAFPARPAFRPVPVARVETADSAAVIWWRIPAVGHPVRSLEVWGRRGGEGAFSRMDSITTFLAAGDTVLGRAELRGLAPRAVYQFYAIPRDIFLNRGPAGDTATAYTVVPERYRLPDSLRVESDDSLGLVLRWRLPDPALVRAIQVFRSTAQDSGWRQVAELPRDARSFIDPRAPEMQVSYYRLTVVGPRNEVSPPTAAVFGYLRSAEAPAPPYGLEARAGAAGRGVRLAWQRATERPLHGYYLFVTDRVVDSITPTTALIQVGPLLPPGDSTWLDTTTTLAPGREYTYLLQAVSRGNLRSGYSNPARFAPTSAVPPSRAAGLRAFVRGRSVQLFWDDLGAADPGHAGYLLFRRPAGGRDTAWRRQTEVPLPANRNSYTDSTATPGVVHEYAVRGVGRGGLEGALSLALRVAVPLGRPPQPAAVRATAAPGGIAVSWAEIEGLTGLIRLYRYARGARPTRLAELGAGVAEYLDRTAQPGQRYYYYATLVVAGVESAPSLEATARR